MFKLYKIVCSESGKAYIGITKGSLAQRWAKHVYEAKKRDYLFGRAIIKYGKAAFAIEQFASARTEADALALEKLLIAQERTRTPIGYNSNDGGIGCLNPSDEVRIRLRAHRHSPEVLAHMSLVQSNRSEEWRTNISRALKGHIKSAETRRKLGYPRTESQKAKIAASLTGRKATAEARAAISASVKAWWAQRKAARAGVPS